jgi:hypothetical protein
MNLKTELKEFIKPLNLPGIYINFDTDMFCHICMGNREFFLEPTFGCHAGLHHYNFDPVVLNQMQRFKYEYSLDLSGCSGAFLCHELLNRSKIDELLVVVKNWTPAKNRNLESKLVGRCHQTRFFNSPSSLKTFIKNSGIQKPLKVTWASQGLDDLDPCGEN